MKGLLLVLPKLVVHKDDILDYNKEHLQAQMM